MNGHFAKRLLLALGITGILSVLAVMAVVASGQSLVAVNGFWPVPFGLFALVLLCVELSGRFRSPHDAYDRSLEDDWDR
jgi:hypothetical protein